MPPLSFLLWAIPDTPPTWWGYATAIIALTALAVALASYRTARATYRRAAPRVSVWTFFPIPPMRDRKMGRYLTGFSFTIRNDGLAPVGVDSFHLNFPRGIVVYSPVAEDLISLRVGNELPVTLPPNDSLSWHYNFECLSTGGRTVRDPDAIYKMFRQKVKLTVVLGNGQLVRKTYRNRGVAELIGIWFDRAGIGINVWAGRMEDRIDAKEDRHP